MSSDVPKFRAADKVILSGIAGGVAGCVSYLSVVAPLDRVKILFQASNPEYQKYAGTWSGAFRAGAQIYKGSGTLGLFQGHSATLLRIFPYAAIKFLAYDEARHLHPAGAISGAISVFFTYPLELLRHQSNRDLFHTLPLLKFYRGFTVSLVCIVPHAGTGFLTWDYPVRAMLTLGGGCVGGGTVRAIWTRGGPRGFFVGLNIGYPKIVPMNAVSFAVWQGMKRMLDV
ncbi:mitochondrial carrier domain-containing protein [Lactarius quietus]|nr:mitochondrial carrier domain-containing protein [Lactarius quietus]